MTAYAMDPGEFGWHRAEHAAQVIADWLGKSRQARPDAPRAWMAQEGRRGRPRRHGRGRGRGSSPGGGFPFGGFGPGGFGPGDFGRGFPPGRFPFGGPGHFGPRGPRRGRGDVRTAILALLAESPMHGYQIIQEITDRSSGMWKPSPGSVYPALQLLEDQGLVRFETDEGRRVVHLTDEGTRHVEENRTELEQFWHPFSGSHTEDVADMRSAMMQVGMAAMQVYRAGTPAQLDRAREILASTTRDLYAVLAEADAEDEPGPDNEPGRS